MIVVDYSEAQVFFKAHEWQMALSALSVYFTCPIDSILLAGIEVSEWGEATMRVKHWVSLREEQANRILLDYHGSKTLLMNDGPLTQLFAQQVLAPIQKAQNDNKTTASNANVVVQRLDEVISRLNVLPPCGAGLDYQAASDRIAPAFSAADAAVGSKHPRT